MSLAHLFQEMSNLLIPSLFNEEQFVVLNAFIGSKATENEELKKVVERAEEKLALNGE